MRRGGYRDRRGRDDRGDFERRPPMERGADERSGGGFDHRRLGPSPRGPPHNGQDVGLGGPPPMRSAVNATPPEPPIDREKVCPLLLRVFPRVGTHHRLEEFARRGEEPKEEIQIYTWPDATLRELCELVKEVNPPARRASAKVSFAFVYPDRGGRSVMRQVGMVLSGRPGPDDSASLRQLKFQTGDFLSVAVQ